MATITVIPDAPRATIDACRIEIAEADYARGPDKTGGQFTYRIETERPAGSTIDKPLKSHEFDVSHDGEHVWSPVVFDEDGDWTLNLVDTEDDSVVATMTVTVA
jgi:hypothetical protein